jgi:hypothetical protein
MTQPQAHRKRLELTPLFVALEQPLALLDAPERRRDVETYLGAARVHLERAVFDLLSAAVAAVNEAGTGVRARLEYEAGTPVLVVETAAGAQAGMGPEPEADADAEAGSFFAFEGDMERVTIRLPRELKELIDNAAGRAALSANSWYLRELARTVAREMRRGGPRREPPPPPWQQRGPRRGGSVKGFVGDD